MNTNERPKDQLGFETQLLGFGGLEVVDGCKGKKIQRKRERRKERRFWKREEVYTMRRVSVLLLRFK